MGSSFPAQPKKINSVDILSNHGGTYRNYIYFKDTEDNQYRYYLQDRGPGGNNELDASQQVIDLTQNVEKYNSGTTNWDNHTGNLFQDDQEYDIYFNFASNKILQVSNSIKTVYWKNYCWFSLNSQILNQ